MPRASRSVTVTALCPLIVGAIASCGSLVDPNTPPTALSASPVVSTSPPEIATSKKGPTGPVTSRTDSATVVLPSPVVTSSETPRAEPASLVGSWVVTTLNPGEPVANNARRRDVMTLTFRADGTFVGSTGCNQIGGDYLQAGKDRLTFPGDSLGSTAVGCVDEPPLTDALMETRFATVATTKARLLDHDRDVIAILRRDAR